MQFVCGVRRLPCISQMKRLLQTCHCRLLQRWPQRSDAGGWPAKLMVLFVAPGDAASPCVQGCRMEYMFWEAALTRQAWPV